MSKEKKELDIRSIPAQLAQFGALLLRYRVILFVVLLCSVYGFVTFRIYSLSNQPTNSEVVQSQIAGLTPNIDQNMVERLQNLKDNSVNVQTLFEKARQNPFAE